MTTLSAALTRLLKLMAIFGAAALMPTASYAQNNGEDETAASFEDIEDPNSADDRGVFVSQIGSGNQADIRQANQTSFARVIQDGNANVTELAQSESGTHHATIAQSGDGNVVLSDQVGSGSSALLLAQEGEANSAVVMQRDDSTEQFSASAILQSGDSNQLILTQDGSDNQARLTQDGNANIMTATQLNSGNRLTWTQLGDGLSDLSITQEGGGALEVTQSNSGAAFAPPSGG